MAINNSDFPVAEPSGKFLVTGIGASSGGIQALKEFFQHVPADSGIAYVVILHLSPDHDSKLAQVLQVVSAIPVLRVTKKTKIAPDHIYVVSPNQHLVIQDGFIAPSPNVRIQERRAPVDIFFRNLADTHGSRAVCVVLSGTGANGSMGLKRIKEMGGVAYVQSPREAEFNEMPRNSIATELVDEVLPVAEIPAKIIAYKNSLGTVQISIEPEKRPEPDQHALREIFTQLRVRTGHDFTNYKRPTLLRRIERRINIRNLPDLPSYVHFVGQNPDEVNALLKDLLISVTNFFRDEKPFRQIEQEILPAILNGKHANDNIRIWVAGCATGEEAYSIAMLVAEKTMGVVDAPKVQIFATDIDERAIASAREGYYTINDAADVSPEQLRQFFTNEGDGYRIKREIREMILFANHNFLKDPPFSRLDLVTCRNVLIYLNSTAQERVMETFHFALNPRGFLFLGTSESVDGASDLYAPFNRENHIYRANEVSARSFPVPESIPRFEFKTEHVQRPDQKENGSPSRMSFGELHHKLLEHYGPPSVVVNEEYDIVHMSEKAGRYLEFTAGEPTQNLLKLVKPEIRPELRSAVYQAVQHKVPVDARNIKLTLDGEPQSLHIHVRPVFYAGDTAQGFILILFEQIDDVQEEATIMLSSDEPGLKPLEEELNRLKSKLRQSIEQHEYQAEELKASNEELQAMNEELRSAAEELETSKEELQSINEELRTVNQELKVKIEEASTTTNNLQNLINSADVGTIFLDRSFSIRMFTPAVVEVFNLKSSDLGRPITDITHKLNYKELLQDAERVLERLTVIEREVLTTDSRAFVMRFLPYRTSDDRINGVIITFFDITRRKQIENALRRSEEHRRLLIESAKDHAIITLDAERRVVSWSSGAETMMGYSEAEIIGRTGDIIFTPEDLQHEVPHKEAEKALQEGMAENERWHLRKDGSRFWGSGSVSPLKDDEEKLIGFVKILRDMTMTRRLEEAKFFLASIVETSNDSIITIDLQRNITSWNKAAEDLYGYPAEEAVGQNLTMLTLPEDFLAILNRVDAIEHSREIAVFDSVRHNKGGELMQLEIVMSPVLNTQGEIIGISTIARDNSERKRREANLAFLAEISQDLVRLTNMGETMDVLGEKISKHFNASRCASFKFDEDADTAICEYDWHLANESSLIGSYRSSDLYTDELLQTLRAGQAVVVTHRDADLRVDGKNLAALDINSYIAIPVTRNNQPQFVLCIFDSIARSWHADEIDLMRELTTRIWTRLERSGAEEALRLSEGRLQRMVNVSKVGVLTFDDGGQMLNANDAFLLMVGYSREEFETGHFSWRDFTAPEHREASLEVWTELQRTGRGGPYEKEYYRRDGLKIWLMFVAADLGDGTLAAYVIDVSDRKKAEDAWRQSEERLANELADTRQLQNISSQIIEEDNIEKLYEQIIDAAIAIAHSSAASLQLYVPEKEALLLVTSKGFAQESATFWQWVSLRSQSSCSAALVKKQRYIISDVETNDHTVGTEDLHSYRWSGIRSVQSTPLVSRKGNVVGMISTHWADVYTPTERELGLLDVLARQAADLFERKQAEEALRQSEARFRTLADAVPQVIWTNHDDGHANYFNQRWYEYSGLSYKESEGLGWQAIVHPEDAPASGEKWENAQAAGIVFDTEYRLRRHDGTYCWFIGRNVPLKDDSGKVTGWFGSATDIENLKKTEEALSQSEARLKITMESATDYCIITMDTSRRVERWSQGATQLFGYPEAEMIGQSADIIFTEEDRKAGAPNQEMETSRDIGHAADERWHLRKDGSLFYASGVMRPIQNGDLTGYVKIMRDTTQQQLFTEELHRLVAERTRELHRSNEELRQFAHVASHDLKEPVRKIKTFNNRIIDEYAEVLPEKVKSYLEKIEVATDRMYTMIEGVLKYSKLGSTAQVFDTVDLHEIMEQVQVDLELLIQSKSAVITKSGLIPITASSLLMYQLFYNLVLNALKFSKEGMPSMIDISANIKQEDNKEILVISVSDNGIGFDPEFEKMVFNTFTRLNSAEEFEGTGLGLALCKKIVERHQGSITARSKENEGATFIINLPVNGSTK